MEKLLRNFRDDRLDAILYDLPRSDPKYALAEKARNYLYEQLSPLLHAQQDITLCASDQENLREFMDRDAEVNGIAMEQVYQQGYRDCVRILRTLGVLA